MGKNVLTPFGKAVRKHRIDKELRMKEMADQLNVSSAFLSAVETGKKPVPVKLAQKISDYFELEHREHAELIKMATESRDSIQLSLDESSSKQRDLAIVFSNKLNKLSNKEIDNIYKILSKQ